jgi:hypothetical protein
MVSDSIEDALDSDDLEEETDDLTNQVLDEIGVDTAAQVGTFTPQTHRTAANYFCKLLYTGSFRIPVAL